MKININKDFEDLPKKEKILENKDYHVLDRIYDRPLVDWKRICKFLKSKIGQPISKVFSDFVHCDWILPQHKTKNYFSKFVELNTFVNKEGQICSYQKYCRVGQELLVNNELYVDPSSQLLCFAKKVREIKKEKDKDFIVLGDYHHLYKLKGIWHEVKFCLPKSPYIEIDGLFYKPWKRFVKDRKMIQVDGRWLMPVPTPPKKHIDPKGRILNKNGKFICPREWKPDYGWKSSIDLTLYRQLNSKELKKYNLKNSVEIKFVKCEKCGGINCERHLIWKSS